MKPRDKALVIAKLQNASALVADAFRTAAHDNSDPALVRELIATKQHLGEAIGKLSDRKPVSLTELMS